MVCPEQFFINMSMAKRAKLDVPASEIIINKLKNGNHCANGVEDDTKSRGLSTQEIMELRSAHIG